MTGLEVLQSAALAGVVRRASEYADSTTVAGGAQRMLPVLPELSAVMPGRGLRRGSTVAISSTLAGASSLMLALLVEASRAGSWCGVVGVPTFGALAAAEMGIALDRLALVPFPGPEWVTVVAALMDGLDVVVTAVPAGVTASVASRLAARARQRGSVLVSYGQWSGADVTLQILRGVWYGLGQGRGRLRSRELTIAVRGRGAAVRPKEITVWLPGPSDTPRAAAGGQAVARGAGAGGLRPVLALVTGADAGIDPAEETGAAAESAEEAG